ncbi:MAG: prepilin-type N-terminal cleavage/methylation domain-containing protein [Nitrospirota bacterium]
MGVHSQNRGFTLIELLIAIFLGMLVMAGGYSVFQASNRATREQNLDNRMQDNARIAMDVLARNFRRAGFLVNFTSYPVGQTVDGMLTKLTTGNSTAGPDQVTILGGTIQTIGTLQQSVNIGASSLVLTSVAGIGVNSVIGVGLTYSGVVTAVNVGSKTVTLSTANPTGATNMYYPGVLLQTGVTSSQTPAPVRLLMSVRYQINSAVAAHPVLEQVIQGTPEPVAEDIEDLQIAYGVDRNKNRIIEAGEWTYVPTANEQDLIRLVRVTLVARTANPDPLLLNVPQTVPSIEDRPQRIVNDGYRRYILTRIIKTNNLDAVFTL